MKYALAVFLSFLLITPTLLSAAVEQPKKPWTNTTEVSMVSANGNTKATTSSAKNEFEYKWTRTELLLEAGGLGSESNGVTTAEQYFAGEKLSFNLDSKNYIFEKFRWDKDRFAGINDRYDINTGYGRNILETELHHLSGEIGGGYISEERTIGPRNDFASGRLYSKYEFTLSETAKFSQDGEYLVNFEDDSDYRANTETAITALLNTRLSLKVGYKWKHVGNPPMGFSKNDTTTEVSLIAKY